MKHRLQGDKKTLRLRQGFRLRAYERFAETSRRDRLQAMDGAPVRQANSLGGKLGCKVVFCALIPRRKAQGCGGEDSGNVGQGHIKEVFQCKFQCLFR